MLIDEFFNKSKFLVMKLTDQLEIKATAEFTLPTLIIDMIGSQTITSITGTLVVQDGRTTTELLDVVTVTDQTFSATPATWTGAGTLNLKVTVNGEYVQTIYLAGKAA